KACKGWPQFRGDSSVYTWLRHIALNTINNFARSRRIQFWRRASLHDVSTIENLVPHPGPSPETTLFICDRVQTVWEAAKRLPSRQQMAFSLRFGEEMEVSQIASFMKITEAAVKVHLFR